MLALLSLLAAACATAPASRPSPLSTPPDLPRSSIAAVLAHRKELSLTDAQVEAMQRRDAQLQQQNDALWARVSRASSATANAGSTGAAPPPAGYGGSGGRHSPRSASAPTHRPEDPLTRLDDNDTRAYLDVEAQVLTEAQRPRAQEIASQYREALYDWQHPRTDTPASPAR